MNARYFATLEGRPVRLDAVQYAPRDPAGVHPYERAAPSQTGRVVRDGPTRAVGRAPDGRIVEADRVVFRKTNPSDHACGARCRAAKGQQCECACGGLYHGAGR